MEDKFAIEGSCDDSDKFKSGLCCMCVWFWQRKFINDQVVDVSFDVPKGPRNGYVVLRGEVVYIGCFGKQHHKFGQLNYIVTYSVFS